MGVKKVKKKNKAWRTYEEVSRDLLNRLAEHFGLGHVEGKQVVPGASGAEWEIDAKGVLDHGDGFLIIECRRYTTTGICQGGAGGLAFCITDTGAKGAIMVSPLGFQKGAKKVAAHAGIVEVKLTPDSTTSDYLLGFLEKIFLGVSDRVTISEEVIIKIEENGKVIEERHRK